MAARNNVGFCNLRLYFAISTTASFPPELFRERHCCGFYYFFIRSSNASTVASTPAVTAGAGLILNSGL
jgi:hypothetical protein